MGGKYRYLLKNVGLMTISNFASKILSFLLVPLYTSVLTTSEYGIFDFYVTSILLLTPLLSSNILDAVIRFSLDRGNNPKDIFGIGLKYCITADLICILLVLANAWLHIIATLTMYPVYFILYFTFSLFQDLMNQFARGLEKISEVAIGGIINSIVVVSLNIFFLLYLDLGIDGYFLSYIIAFAITFIYLIVRLKVWHYIVWHKTNNSLKKEMLSYSRPLIFQNIGSWINNLSDRYIVMWLCGAAANGVYSVSYKIPSMLTVFQTIFNQAWTISAVKSYNENQDDFYEKIYKLYNIGMVVLCSVLISLEKWVAKLLFAKEFYLAWEYAPFLIVSVVFSSMSSLLGGILIAAKKSNDIAITTVVGAAINTILNISLVLLWGPVGAAIATLISYFLVWITRVISVNKLIKIKISLKRDILAYIVLVLQSVMLLWIPDGITLYISQTICLCSIIGLMYRDMKLFYQSMMLKIKMSIK